MDQRKDIGLSKLVNESKTREQAKPDDGIKRGNLSQAKAKLEAERELQGFPYANVYQRKPELWRTIADFYGIDESFPCECLYAQQEGNQKRIVMTSEGLHRMLLTCKKKPKLMTVNIGLKMFERNKNEKIETPYRLV